MHKYNVISVVYGWNDIGCGCGHVVWACMP